MTDLQLWKPVEITEHDLANMQRRAKIFAASKLVPKAYQEAPEDIVAVDLSLRPLGSQADLNTLKHCYVIDGAVSFSAQMQLAFIRTHGHDAWFDEASDDTFARIFIRRRGQSRVHAFRYTIDMARRARLLDAWVEKWETAASGKRYCAGRYVVSTDGTPNEEPAPEWAKKLIAGGQVKRRDPWFDGRENQLMCRAATRAIGKVCPEVLLGLPDFSAQWGERDMPTGLDLDTGEVVTEDDDIVDAELVDDEAATRGEPHGAPAPSGDDDAAVEADARPAGGGVQAPRPPLVTEPWVRHVAIECTNAGLDRDKRLVLIEHAIGRPVTTSKAVLQGPEAAAVEELLERLRAGEVVVAQVRDGLRVVEVDPTMRGPG